MRPTIASVLFCTSLIVSPVQAQEVTPQYGIAMHGDLKYRVDFQHFDYVNPDAPKGGDVHLADIGTFDSLTFVNDGILDYTVGPASTGLTQLACTDD